jgi:quercetin dioxygenase-like cupin family protein
MIEKNYTYSLGDEQKIEKVIFDENINYIHMVFPKDEGLPEHNANSNLYISVIRGHLSITLGIQETHVYPRGTVITLPEGTRMKISNYHDEVLELIVVKAPAPKK